MSQFIFTIPERGEGEMHRNECSAPDYDEILRDTARKYMKEANRSPSEIAHSLGMPAKKVKAWLAGKTGDIDLVSAFAAATGVNTIDSLLRSHEAYGDNGAKISTMRDMLFSRMSHSISLEQVRLIIEMQMLMHEVPESTHFFQRGIADAINYAEHLGVDVKGKREALERGLRPFFQDADERQTG